MLYPSVLDFIGNAPAGFTDQPDAAHPAGFPIMTIINACFGASSKFRTLKVYPNLNGFTSWGEFRKPCFSDT